jgi:hypothetical protein
VTNQEKRRNPYGASHALSNLGNTFPDGRHVTMLGESADTNVGMIDNF